MTKKSDLSASTVAPVAPAIAAPVTEIATMNTDTTAAPAPVALTLEERIEAAKAASKAAFQADMAAKGYVSKAATKSSEPVDYHQSGLKAAATYKAKMEAEILAAFEAGKPIPLTAAQKAVQTRLARQAAAKAAK